MYVEISERPCSLIIMRLLNYDLEKEDYCCYCNGTTTQQLIQQIVLRPTKHVKKTKRAGSFDKK